MVDTTGERRPLAVDVVAFDVNETLFDLDGLLPRFTAVGLPEHMLALWFARVLRDGFALTVLGEYRPFPEVGADVLRGLAPQLTADQIGQVLSGFAELDPHPDVEPALRLLREADVRAVTLTNGNAQNTAKLLDRAGLSSYVEATLSVDAVQRWKPAPEPYLHAARTCGAQPGRVALVAGHAWDVHGARRAGLRTAYVQRTEKVLPEIFAAADVSGQTLDDAVRSLLQL